MFSPLAPLSMEALARRLAQLDVQPGAELITQGARGDRCYLVADGRVEVARDGVVVAQLRRGDVFGEVALLRNEPRNATCTAAEPSVLFAMEKDDFLEAVTGHPRVSAEAHRLAAERTDAMVRTR